MRILSPMAYGNGAHVVHKLLENNLKGYTVCNYNPNYDFFPFVLPFVCNLTSADIIHTTPNHGLFFHKRKIPLVLTFHGFVHDSATQHHSTFLQRIHHRTDMLYFTKKSLEVAHSITAVSKFTAELIRQEFNYQKEIKVIYNGIDTNRFRPVSKKQNANIKVLFCGNLTRRKGAHLLPYIAELLQENITIQFTRGLRGKHKKIPSPILQDMGSINHREIDKLYQQADILIFPTVREGFGLAAAEAMACGLPVVATNCSSIPELVVDGKGGYLCELGNIQEFAERINQLADSVQMRKEMGQFNRHRIEQKFTLQGMVGNYRTLFEEVLSDR